MVVGCTTTYAISAYHHLSYKFEPRSWQGQWFSPGTPSSFTNKTDRHNIAQILLKVELNTINHQPTINFYTKMYNIPNIPVHVYDNLCVLLKHLSVTCLILTPTK